MIARHMENASLRKDVRGIGMATLPCFIRTDDDIVGFVLHRYNDTDHEPMYIGFPKFIPAGTTASADLLFAGRPYRRSRGYASWMLETDHRVREYRRRVSVFGENLFCFPTSRIIDWYDPLEYPLPCSSKSREVAAIRGALHRHLGIDERAIGVEGSMLLGIDTEQSDIDVLVYGYAQARRLTSRFPRLFDLSGFRRWTTADASAQSEERKHIGFGTAASFLVQEQRRLYGWYQRKRFSITPVLNDSDADPIDWHRQLTAIGIFNGTVRITSDRYGCVTPSVYGAVDIKSGQAMTVEIINPYGLGQARVGEQFHLEGNMYVNTHNRTRHVILAFWTAAKERFDLLIDNATYG